MTLRPSEILNPKRGVAYALRDDVFLLYYLVPPEPEDLRGREPLLRRLTESGGKCAYLSVVDTRGDHAMPSAESRRETREQLERYAHAVHAGAVVLLGSGMKLQIVRALLKGVMTFRRGPIETRFFADEVSAARWLSVRLGWGVGREARVERIVAAVGALRAIAEAS